MDRLKLSGKHILLLLLYSPGATPDFNEPIIGRTRIIKMMFLFERKIMKDFLKNSDIEFTSLPEFFAWNYGPFSKDIYDDVEFFINNEFVASKPLDNEKTEIELQEFENWMDDYLINEEDELFSNIINQECFQLTEKGIKFVEEKIYQKLTSNQKSILIKFKESINEVTLEAIIRYVYLEYPEYSIKSKIKDRYTE